MVRVNLQFELLLQILTPSAKLAGRIFLQKLPSYLLIHFGRRIRGRPLSNAVNLLHEVGIDVFYQLLSFPLTQLALMEHFHNRIFNILDVDVLMTELKGTYVIHLLPEARLFVFGGSGHLIEIGRNHCVFVSALVELQPAR